MSHRALGYDQCTGVDETLGYDKYKGVDESGQFGRICVTYLLTHLNWSICLLWKQSTVHSSREVEKTVICKLIKP